DKMTENLIQWDNLYHQNSLECNDFDESMFIKNKEVVGPTSKLMSAPIHQMISTKSSVYFLFFKFTFYDNIFFSPKKVGKPQNNTPNTPLEATLQSIKLLETSVANDPDTPDEELKSFFVACKPKDMTESIVERANSLIGKFK